MKETKMFKCSCPNRNAILIKKAFLDLANEIEGMADSDQWGGSRAQNGLYEIARMIRDNQFDDIILKYQNE